MGVAERFTYVSTAGGAFLEWLEGKALPKVEVLKGQVIGPFANGANHGKNQVQSQSQ